MKTLNQYQHLESAIIGMLKSPTFKAHGKTWNQVSNIWQFFCYRSIIARSGRDAKKYILDNWNLSRCYRRLASSMKPGIPSGMLLDKLAEVATLESQTQTP